MKLTLNKFHVKDIQFAEASSFENGVLYISKKELACDSKSLSAPAPADKSIVLYGVISGRILPVSYRAIWGRSCRVGKKLKGVGKNGKFISVCYK